MARLMGRHYPKQDWIPCLRSNCATFLGKLLEWALSATLLFDHPTIEALSEFLWNEVRQSEAPTKKQMSLTGRRTVRRFGNVGGNRRTVRCRGRNPSRGQAAGRGMSDFLDQIKALSPPRLALLAVKLKEQLDGARGDHGRADRGDRDRMPLSGRERSRRILGHAEKWARGH